MPRETSSRTREHVSGPESRPTCHHSIHAGIRRQLERKRSIPLADALGSCSATILHCTAGDGRSSGRTGAHQHHMLQWQRTGKARPACGVSRLRGRRSECWRREPTERACRGHHTWNGRHTSKTGTLLLLLRHWHDQFAHAKAHLKAPAPVNAWNAHEEESSVV